MKTHNPKISFDATPAPQQIATVQRIRIKPAQDMKFERLAGEALMPELAALAATMHPKAQSRLAVIGLMSRPEPTFLERNGTMLGAVAALGTTFILGLGSSIWLFGGDDAASQQQSTFFAPIANIDLPEKATRAASDLTDVSDIAVPVGTKAPDDHDLTNAVLAGLRPTVAKPDETSSSKAQLVREALEILHINKLRMLREGVIAGIYDIELFTQNGVTRVRLRTANTSLTNASASTALRAAVTTGEINISKSLLRADGSVDIDTMMFDLVQTSLKDNHSSEGGEAARDMSGKIFTASTLRTQNVNGNRIYSVQAADSLAYIALQFYGDPNAYKRIMAANRVTLQTPDEIQIGQRLIIPS